MLDAKSHLYQPYFLLLEMSHQCLPNSHIKDSDSIYYASANLALGDVVDKVVGVMEGVGELESVGERQYSWLWRVCMIREMVTTNERLHHHAVAHG